MDTKQNQIGSNKNSTLAVLHTNTVWLKDTLMNLKQNEALRARDDVSLVEFIYLVFRRSSLL